MNFPKLYPLKSRTSIITVKLNLESNKNQIFNTIVKKVAHQKFLLNSKQELTSLMKIKKPI